MKVLKTEIESVAHNWNASATEEICKITTYNNHIRLYIILLLNHATYTLAYSIIYVKKY